jgi:dihydropteroate synthase
MREALAAEVDMINDINGFRAEGAIDAVRDSEAGLCVMHMQGQPQTMQQEPRYDDVVAEVEQFLQAQVDLMKAAGIDERICIDPGLVLARLWSIIWLCSGIRGDSSSLDLPLLAGMSRKSDGRAVTGKPLERRMAGSIGAALAAAQQGAMIIRVHDVAETVDALAMWQADAATCGAGRRPRERALKHDNRFHEKHGMLAGPQTSTSNKR